MMHLSLEMFPHLYSKNVLLKQLKKRVDEGGRIADD